MGLTARHTIPLDRIVIIKKWFTLKIWEYQKNKDGDYTGSKNFAK